MESIKSWGACLVDAIVPRRCTVCGGVLVEGETVMCLHCLTTLPRIGVDDFTDNKLTERLVSLRAPLERATALFYYSRGSDYVKLIHDTKYNGRPTVGRRLAREHAARLAGEGFFDGIDLLMPLPLHPLKEWRRGYNQSYEIALGLSEVSGIEIADNLRTKGWHGTQTRRSAMERRENVADRYKVIHPGTLAGLHVLVVDDVITTGSTMLSAIETIHAASPTTRISVYSLALTEKKS